MSALNWTFFAGTPTIRDCWEAKYGGSAWGYRVSAKIEAWRDKRNKRKTIYALRLQVSTIDAPYFFEDWDEGTKNGPDRSALLGHNFVYQETKPYGFYSSYFHQRISS